jgi:hypothetical protein
MFTSFMLFLKAYEGARCPSGPVPNNPCGGVAKIGIKDNSYFFTTYISLPGADDLIVRPVTAEPAAELTLDVWGDACRGRDCN